MKVLLIATLLVSSAFANEDKGAKLEDIKARIVANIDQRIQAQTQHKSCVQAAASKEALQACQHTFRTAMKSMKSENHEERESKRAEWKAKREARKAEKVAGKKK